MPGSAYYMVITRTLLAIFLYTLISSLICSNYVLAEEQTCVVLSVDKNAWLTRKDTRVKSNLVVGDALYEGDYVQVNKGNSIELVFDKAGKNVVHIEGKASFLIYELYPTRLELFEGNAYAFLDGSKKLRAFKIASPSAVTTVYGTRYKIGVLDGKSEVLNYKGRVRVSGRDTEGNETIDFVLLYDREKTDIADIGSPPKSAAPLTDVEAYLAGMIDNKIQLARQEIGGSGRILRRLVRTSESLYGEDSQERPTSVLIPSRESKEVPEGGQILF